MMPRVAVPTELQDNKKVRKTKAQIAGQKKVEKDLAKIPTTLSCPKDVTGIAKQEWDRVVKLWKSTEFRYLNDLDMAVLKCYCDAVERYELIRQEWANTKKLIVADPRTKDGKALQPILAYLSKEMLKWGEAISLYASKLCLDTVNREKLAIAGGKLERDKADPFDIMFKESIR